MKKLIIIILFVCCLGDRGAKAAPQRVPDSAIIQKNLKKLAHKKAGPETGWDDLTRRERFMIKCMYKLAKEHWPALTLEQYKAQLKVIWEDTE